MLFQEKNWQGVKNFFQVLTPLSIAHTDTKNYNEQILSKIGVALYNGPKTICPSLQKINRFL